MLDFQVKQKIRRFAYARPTLVFLGIVLAVTLNATYNMYQNMRETAENRRIALNESEKLEAKQKLLEGEIGQLQTERGMEEEIRKKFRVVKEGESVIIVVDDKENSATALNAASSSRSFFGKILNVFRW